MRWYVLTKILIQMSLLKSKVIVNMTESNTVQKEVWVALGKFISIDWKKASNVQWGIWLSFSVFIALAKDHCNSFDIKNTFIHTKPCWKNNAERMWASLLTKWFCKYQCVYMFLDILYYDR